MSGALDGPDLTGGGDAPTTTPPGPGASTGRAGAAAAAVPSPTTQVARPDLTRVHDLRVTVESIGGRSVCGLRVGDWFEVRDSSQVRLPDGGHFCLYALAAVLPLLPAKQRPLPAGDWLARDTLVACPDPEERLVMRIERLGEVELATDELT